MCQKERWGNLEGQFPLMLSDLECRYCFLQFFKIKSNTKTKSERTNTPGILSTALFLISIY